MRYYESRWTDESDQLSTLMGPGLFVAGHAWSIPKFVAAPADFSLCIAVSYGLFALVEHVYARLSAWLGEPLKKAQLRHRMFTIAGFLSITSFYWYAGRSNLSLMPTWAVRLVDFTIAALAVTWLISLSRGTRTSICASAWVRRFANNSSAWAFDPKRLSRAARSSN